MIRNYLVIAIRYVLRHKVFTFINISGLTLGITCTLLIFLFVQDELGFDRFHRDTERIYRLGMTGTLQGKRIRSSSSGFVVAPTLLRDVQEIEAIVRLANWRTFPIRYEDKTFTEKYLLLADPNFFRFFNFRLITGNPDSVLDAPHKIVITESAARRYFGYKRENGNNPVGKTLVLAQGYTATVSGIAEDPPLQSHFHFTHILSLASWDDHRSDSWMDGSVHSYLKCRPGADLTKLEEKLTSIFNGHVSEELKKATDLDLNQFTQQGNAVSLLVQPLKSIHLHSDMDDEIEDNGNLQQIYLFAAIALFITILACINFMNLFTARSASRSKEIGIRKAAGAQNHRLIGQFLLESYLYVIVSFFISLCIVLVLLGPFNYFTRKQIHISSLADLVFVGTAIVFLLITGLLAGSYPSFYLTQFNPVEVLRGKLRASLRSYGIRNILVVFQFFVSTGLIIATVVVYHQLTFIDRVDLGFDKSNLVNLLHTKNLGQNGQAFKKELQAQPGILAASFANRLPPNLDWQAIVRPDDTNKEYLVNVYEMDYDHLATMGYTLVKGRFFSADVPGDSGAVILNETAARLLGIDIGKTGIFSYYDSPDPKLRNVIGILKDFNCQSLKVPIQPMMGILGNEPNWEMAIRLATGYPEQKIDLIRSMFRKYAAGAPFEFSMVDQNFAKMNTTERKVGMLFFLFTFLAIFIACLGLLGLAAFTAEQRTKEIGIRKVLGANIRNIMILLNGDFMKLVLTANFLAWPVAGLLMRQWLNQFAYHVSVSWWVFPLAGLLTTLIALLSVSLQASKAATGNPVNSLRND
jgi:putative ABC transport system permease protein